MSSGMESTYRYWRRRAAAQIKEIKRLARARQCGEMKVLFRELRDESVPSLVGWVSYANLNKYAARYCAVPKRRRKK